MDTLVQHLCRRCGGELTRAGEQFTCKYCGSHYDVQTAQSHTEAMKQLFDQAKLELVGNLRRILYDAVTAEYISRDEVIRASDELRKFLPDDFAAVFFKAAASKNIREINRAISEIDTAAHYEDIGLVVSFLVKSMTADEDYLLALNDLVERAYKGRDLSLFNRYATEVSVQAERVRAGIYETAIPRDVFVAYSGRDMKQVLALVEELEGQGISCFVAARNLRHGVGAVENYDRALKEAMDNCRSVVFVSSQNSRNFSCDALRVELTYLKKRDLDNAPPAYRHRYAALPAEYKKPRVEYVIEPAAGESAADEIVHEFFEGFEWAYTPAEVATRVVKQLLEVPVEVPSAQPTPVAAAVPPTTASAVPNLQNTVKRMYAFLAEGNWAAADACCERILDQDMENAEAYLGKLMAELQVKKRTDLSKCKQAFTSNQNYQKAMRFGSEDLKRELTAAVDAINHLLELERREKVYMQAVGLMKKKTSSDYRKAAKLFASVAGYKDAAEQAEECGRLAAEAAKDRALTQAKKLMYQGEFDNAIKELERLNGWRNAAELIETCRSRMAEIAAEQERQRVEAQERAAALAARERKKKKAITAAAIIIPIICAVIVFAIVLNTVIIPTSKYNDAVDLMAAGQYSEAIAIFEEIADHKDSTGKIDECNTAILQGKYDAAVALMDAGKYEEAIAAFEEIKSFGNSSDKINESNTAIKQIQYDAAVVLMNEGKYQEAISAFEAIKDFSDSTGKIDECNTAILQARYDAAVVLMNEGKYQEAISAFEAIGDFSDSRDKITECSVAVLAAASVGEVIQYGAYEQDNNTSNGKEAIEWIVLAKENDRALVVSKYILDCQLYHTSYTSVTWKTCTLRTWLNGTFLNGAFTAAERTRILTSTITNPDNPSYGTEGGNDTTDKLFLLSIDEANRYFGSDTGRAASATAYAKAQGGYVNSDNGNSWWWLRSPGYLTRYAAYVYYDGGVGDRGDGVHSDFYGVRPAFWIDLAS